MTTPSRPSPDEALIDESLRAVAEHVAYCEETRSVAIMVRANHLATLLALARSASEAKARLERLESALEFLCSRDVVVTHTEDNGDTYSKCPEAASLLLMATEVGWTGKAGE